VFTLFLTAVMTAAFIGSLFMTLAITPAIMRLAVAIGAIDEGGYRKVYRGAIPLLGGLAVAVPFIGLALSAAVGGQVIAQYWLWFHTHYRAQFDVLFSFAGIRLEFLVLAIGGMAIVALGLIDDTRGLRAKWKLLGQIAVALFVCLSGYTLNQVSLPFMGETNLGIAVGGLVTVLWLVGLINAFNLIDGIDGLASGIAFIGAAALVVLGVVQEDVLVTLTGAALAGSLIAFLRYNFPPARIFLGDTGSMFLGYTLATMSLMGARKTEAAVIFVAPMLALGLPIFETLVSIVRRYFRGVPIFVGDSHHTHHRLLGKGYSQPKVVLTLYSAALLLAVAAVMSALRPAHPLWLLGAYALYGGTLAYIAWLAGYLRPETIKRTFERRRSNTAFQALGQYASLRLNTDDGWAQRDRLLELCCLELGIRHIGIRLRNGALLMPSTDSALYKEPDELDQEIHVKSAEGHDILIRFEFDNPPDDSMRQDVTACLAGIFDQIRLEGQTGL
jgi:UDP-GlcNAc:undecaprenyl-phosphate/decaprenyl-phosphate GlcNAc-1-phosphate transferase